ncbi:preprotein translocase subunit SecG [bacterium]|nr:MAG: preprotein translocase subunit SecG [bacterium]
MMGFIVVLHVIICILLIILVLIQSGRGGGLVDNLSNIESMFGTKTNAFLTKSTTVLSTLFFITCLSLAVLSLKQSRSLMETVKPESVSVPSSEPVKAVAPVEASKEKVQEPVKAEK